MSSAVTGLDHGFGEYSIRGLAPGDYMVMLQRLNPSAIGGSSIGPLTFQPTLPVNEQYFERATGRMIARQPLELLEVADKISVRATLKGGGHAAQAEALRHGIARALIAQDPERRGALKKAGFLTRDDREKERKKYGQPGARKRFQYSKR